MVIGSCFAENIGNILKHELFDVHINPYGIVYNPISIVQQLSYITQNKEFTANDLFEHNGLWHSWQHHGSFSGTDQNDVLFNINKQLDEAHKQLKKAEWLIITMGSAYYYCFNDGHLCSLRLHRIRPQPSIHHPTATASNLHGNTKNRRL